MVGMKDTETRQRAPYTDQQPGVKACGVKVDQDCLTRQDLMGEF